MKTIEPVSIWTNGLVDQATILDVFGTNVSLGNSAMFTYSLYTPNDNLTMLKQIANGNLYMTGEAYEQWTVDSYAWDWVAEQLNLTITGDYIPPAPTAPPQPVPPIETPNDPAIESPAV